MFILTKINCLPACCKPFWLHLQGDCKLWLINLLLFRIINCNVVTAEVFFFCEIYYSTSLLKYMRIFWFWLRLEKNYRNCIITGQLLTYSMVQSPSWEANWFAASQEIPRISRNPKVHYRTHKRPPPIPILSQPNPVHIPTSHLLEIHPNIIHPSTPRSPQWALSLRIPHQDPIHSPLLPLTRHMPYNIGWGIQIT